MSAESLRTRLKTPIDAGVGVPLVVLTVPDLAAALEVIEAARRVSRFLVESPHYQGEKIDGAFDLEWALALFEALP